ncbi:MAG: hypothetical protein P9L94_18985 [Candidatus Hinthialibacter antarcticus]|nr:hypothetical protein [Candidatus Hinthialibacter antarcticus]
MKRNMVSYGITAFIDILGFSEKVLSAKTYEDINEIQLLLEKIQKEFDFKTKDSSIKDVQKLYKKKVLAFSDCVVINIPLKSNATKYDGTFDPLMIELSNFAIAQGSCVQNGLFLRGGIDLGWWFQSRTSLISKSLVSAYKIEKLAKMPIIALSKGFYNFLSKHKHRDYYCNELDPVKDLFKKYKSIKNGIEVWYLDYISICLDSLDWRLSERQVEEHRNATPDKKTKIERNGYRKNTDNWLIKHAQKIEESYVNSPDNNVCEKYSWLSKYHNRMVNGYSKNPKCKCSLARARKKKNS